MTHHEAALAAAHHSTQHGAIGALIMLAALFTVAVIVPVLICLRTPLTEDAEDGRGTAAVDSLIRDGVIMDADDAECLASIRRNTMSEASRRYARAARNAGFVNVSDLTH